MQQFSSALLVLWALPQLAAAHSFYDRYDLPIPLSFFLWGAALTVALPKGVTASVAGAHIEVQGPKWKGTRDRSWGVRPVGEALETDTAYALAAKQITATGIALETDLSEPLGSARPVGRADETDAAFADTGLDIEPVGKALETDAAYALAAKQIAATGSAAETDTAASLVPKQITATGSATEADAAYPLGVARPVGSVAETDAALATLP